MRHIGISAEVKLKRIPGSSIEYYCCDASVVDYNVMVRGVSNTQREACIPVVRVLRMLGVKGTIAIFDVDNRVHVTFGEEERYDN